MKILTVNTSDTAGGAARAAMRLHRGLMDLGLEARFLAKDCRSGEDFVVPLSRFAPQHPLSGAWAWGREKVRNKIQQYRWGKYPGRAESYQSDLRAVPLHGALQKLDFDLLHLHWINQRFFPLAHLRRVGKPLVWTLHDCWPFCGLCHYFGECQGYRDACGSCPQLASHRPGDLSHRLWKRKRALLQGVDLHIVTPSRWLAGCARESSLLRDKDLRVIPNCIDTKVFSPGEACKEPGKPLVLYGAMNAVRDKRKGWQNLCAALKILEARGEVPFELGVFGAQEGELSPEMRPGRTHIIPLGQVQDTAALVALYRRAAVTVVPSLAENLSCTLMESLSCGTPVVAFDIGGNGDLVDHLQNGYLARKEDNADLAAGLRWCLHQNAHNRLGRAAREKVCARFAPEVVCGQYVQLYETLLRTQ